MKEALNRIREEAIAAILDANAENAIEELRIRYLGKKGELTSILKQMGSLSPEERPIMGQLANDVRKELDARIAEKAADLKKKAEELRFRAETLDVTLPGKRPVIGSRHPLETVMDDIKEIFLGMGFNVADGPEVEYDHYCFEMLNMPKHHPARDTQDTFYINENVLLRTQTSSVQIRTMLSQKPPIRVISPGRVYRVDTVDATHSPIFHQVEGLVVDKGITMADLKGTLAEFIHKLYGKDIGVRFRPHHFPYTEPSAEMDMECFKCHGKGCALCKNEGYIELLGCGMVRPEVLEGCGIDSSVYSGFAFGVGADRITMMRYGINDLRVLFENDMRFLQQF